MPDVRRHEFDHWAIALPAGLIGGPVARLTNPEFSSMAIFRGWLGETPMSVIVSTRSRAGATLRGECRRLGARFHEPSGDGVEIAVPGAGGARRIDGLLDLEEGVGAPPDWTERVTIVVSGARDEFVVVTLRRPLEAADLDPVVEQAVASLEIRADAGPSAPPRG